MAKAAGPRPPAPGVERSTRFAKAKKRLRPRVQLALDAQVRRILADPLRGESKAGALRGVRVQKFKLGPVQFLLAYQFDEARNVVELLDLGPHENFYRDLEAYLKAR